MNCQQQNLFFLKVCEIVANVLYAVGQANDNVEPVPDTEGCSGRLLASDGSTNVEKVLWTGKASFVTCKSTGIESWHTGAKATISGQTYDSRNRK